MKSLVSELEPDRSDFSLTDSADLLAQYVPAEQPDVECLPPNLMVRKVSSVSVKPPRRRTSISWAALLVFFSGLFAAAITLHQPKPTWKPAIRPIETYRVGQAVRSENPTGEEDLTLGDHVDPATWRHLILKAPKLDDSWADVELLRPLWWLNERNAKVGEHIDINVPHCGIEGEAEILAINPCPPVEPTPKGYRTITGTFRHRNAEVIDLYVEGQEKPIGTTPNHPFWSEDQTVFVRADQLTNGDRLRDIQGERVLAGAQSPRHGMHTVFNLEVAGTHTYFVGELGCVVHNGNPNPCLITGGPHKKTTKSPKDGKVSHHMPSKKVMREELGIDELKAPAIKMDQVDHALTSSHGNSKGSAQWRDDTAKLIRDEGRGHPFFGQARTLLCR